jgi:hypothetical protein
MKKKRVATPTCENEERTVIKNEQWTKKKNNNNSF